MAMTLTLLTAGLREWQPTNHSTCIGQGKWSLNCAYYTLLRKADFKQYQESLIYLVIWFFALDQTNYFRWLSVHICDMASLSQAHTETHKQFQSGAFSVIALEHAHEQVNALVKGEGGAVWLTGNPNALRRWMLGGPELSRKVEEYEKGSSMLLKIDRQHHGEN